MNNDPALLLADIKNKLESQKVSILKGETIDFEQLHQDIESFLKVANISGDNFELYREDLNHIRAIITGLSVTLSYESDAIKSKIYDLNQNISVNKAYMVRQNSDA